MERLFSSSLVAKFVSLSAPRKTEVFHLKHYFGSKSFLYHVMLLKRESVNSNHKFKKQEEVNIYVFQRNVLLVGPIL